MSQTNNKRRGQGWLAWYIPLLLAEFAWLLACLMRGKNVAVLNPKGWVSDQQVGMLIFTVSVLFLVAVPTVLFLYFTAWKYRESNTNVKRNVNQKHGKFFVFTIWAIPSVFMFVLMTMMIPATHNLEPRKAISAHKDPITIQVVAMRWKWVFLYPEQQVATVNFVQIPEDTPVVFELTADNAPMSSFWIPNLGGQLYAMTGHVNRLNLLAEKVGDYPGSSAEINGAGFAGMKFITRVSSSEDFNQWVQVTKASPDVLDATTYAQLVKPSENNVPVAYSDYQTDLYSSVTDKYASGHNHGSEESTE